jgi:Tfp pilus assembly protein PilF
LARAAPIVPAGPAATLNNIGGVYDALGQQDQALDYYRQALPILEEVGDRAGENITRVAVRSVLGGD